MKISLVQFDIEWENKEINLSKIEKMLNNVPDGTDFVALPEMFTTGFTMTGARLAETEGGQTSLWLSRVAGERKYGICGSYIVREDESVFNRFLFIEPGRTKHTYDKRHLFSIGGEDKIYTSGNKRSLFAYRGFRISAIICYDLRFPVWIRNRNEFDLLICVSNWPESRREVWNTLLIARAIENQCFVAGVNRVGKDRAGNSYAGESVILDPRGNLLANLPPFEEGIVSAKIDLDDLIEFRKKFPVWKDADEFLLNP